MDPKDLANNMLPSFVEILLGAPIYMLAKRYRIKEPTAAFLIGVVGAAICIATILISGKPNALRIIIQLSVITAALILWLHVLYGTWKEARGSTSAKGNENLEARLGSLEGTKDGEEHQQLPSPGAVATAIPDWTHLDRGRHTPEIRRAVYRKCNVDIHTDCAPSYLCHHTNFESYLLKDESRGWVAQEIQYATVTKSLQSEIEAVSKTIENKYKDIQAVVVIVLVYESLSLSKKGDLLHQLEAVRANGSLSEKLSFQVWDKDDL